MGRIWTQHSKKMHEFIYSLIYTDDKRVFISSLNYLILKLETTFHLMVQLVLLIP